MRAASDTRALSSRIRSFVNKVAKAADCDPETTFRALRKTKAFDNLPRLGQVEAGLMNAIADLWEGAGECTIPVLRSAVRELVNECMRASSLAHEEVLPAYLAVTSDPVADEVSARLISKRFDRDRLLQILERGKNITSTLEGPTDDIEIAAGDESLLTKKLDAGGFLVPSVISAKDLRDKAEYLGVKWTKIHGSEEGKKRYSHVKSLMLHDGAAALEAMRNYSEPFGPEMLEELRGRIEQRRADNDQLYDCRNEHLEGVAFALTSECKLQWSRSTPWEDA